MLHPLALMPLAQLTPVGTTAPATPAAPATSITGAAPAVAPIAVPAGANTAAASQAAITASVGVETQPAPKPTMLSQIMGFAPIILMFVVLYFILFRGQRKTEKKRKEMISEMKKGDNVMTIGGLIARIVSIDGDNVVLKIDESANVKATYTKRSIQQVLSDDDKAK